MNQSCSSQGPLCSRRGSEDPLLCSLLEHGFTILHVDDISARSAILGQAWDRKKLPALREVVAENLRHDLDDAKQLQVLCRAQQS